MAIEISTQRPALDVTVDGQTVRWEYDVVMLKLEQQRLQDRSGQREPTAADLVEFAEYLKAQGLPNCNADIAFRMWSLIIVQFRQLATGIAAQVADAVKDV